MVLVVVGSGASCDGGGGWYQGSPTVMVVVDNDGGGKCGNDLQQWLVVVAMMAKMVGDGGGSRRWWQLTVVMLEVLNGYRKSGGKNYTNILEQFHKWGWVKLYPTLRGREVFDRPSAQGEANEGSLEKVNNEERRSHDKII